MPNFPICVSRFKCYARRISFTLCLCRTTVGKLSRVTLITEHHRKQPKRSQRNSKIPKGQTEIVKSEDRQDHGQQNETKDKHRAHNTTLKTKAGVNDLDDQKQKNDK